MHRRGYRKRHRGGPRLDTRKGVAPVRAVKHAEGPHAKEGRLKLISAVNVSGTRMNVQRALVPYTDGVPKGSKLAQYRPGLPNLTYRAALGVLMGTGDFRDLDKPLIVGVTMRSAPNYHIIHSPEPPFQAYTPGLGTYVTSYDRATFNGFGIGPYHGIVDLVPSTHRMYVPAIAAGPMIPYGGEFPDRRRDWETIDAGYDGDDFSVYNRHSYVVKSFVPTFGRFTMHHLKVHSQMRVLFQRARVSGQVELDLNMKTNPAFIDMVQDMMDPNARFQFTSATTQHFTGGTRSLWVNEKEAFETLRDMNIVSKFKSAAAAIKAYIIWQPHSQEGFTESDLKSSTWTKLRRVGRRSRVCLNPHRLTRRERLVPMPGRPLQELPLVGAAPATTVVSAGAEDTVPTVLTAGEVAGQSTDDFEIVSSFGHARPKNVELTPYKVLAPKKGIADATTRVVTEGGYELKEMFDEDETLFCGDMALAIKTKLNTSFASIPDWFWVHWVRKYPFSMTERNEDGTPLHVFDDLTNTQRTALFSRLYPTGSTGIDDLTHQDMVWIRKAVQQHVCIVGCDIGATIGVTYSGLALDNRDGGPELFAGDNDEPFIQTSGPSASHLEQVEDTAVAHPVPPEPNP